MRFYKEDYAESAEPLANPDCGWYRIYPFELKEAAGTVFPPLDVRALAGSLEESGGRWCSSISAFSGKRS